MGRKYVVTAADITVGATTLVWINPPASGIKEIRITRVEVSFLENATSAQQRVQLVTQVSAFPTLTAGATPRALDLGMPASVITSATTGAAGTAGVDASAEGAGGKTVRHEAAFNVLNGWLWVPTPDGEIVLPSSNPTPTGFGVYFPVAPTTVDGWSCTVEFEEV